MVPSKNKLALSWLLMRRLWKAHQLSVKFFFSSVKCFYMSGFRSIRERTSSSSSSSFAFWAALQRTQSPWNLWGEREQQKSSWTFFSSSSFPFCLDSFNGLWSRKRPITFVRLFKEEKLLNRNNVRLMSHHKLQIKLLEKDKV